MRLVLAAEMKEMDSLTIRELGIPGVVLMENAARGATRLFLVINFCQYRISLLILFETGLLPIAVINRNWNTIW